MVAYYLILFLKEMITNHLEDSVEDIEIIVKSNMIFTFNSTWKSFPKIATIWFKLQRVNLSRL